MNKIFIRLLVFAALLSLTTIEMVAQSDTNLPRPLAGVGSHWNYWIAKERSFGFRKYEVVAHETIVAAVDRNGNGQKDVNETEEEILAAKITMSVYENWHGSTDPGQEVKEGDFYAFRQGNASYVLRDVNFSTGNMPKKFWFKWIDMDAEPGDEWVITQFGPNGNTLFDWVQVSYKKEVVIDGQTIPVIAFSPACHSRYTQSNDFTSRLALNGLFNIDYWAVSSGGTPTPEANGVVYSPPLHEMSVGMLCAEVDGSLLTTDNLMEYVRSNNPSMWGNEPEEGYCNALYAPEPSAEESQRALSMRFPAEVTDKTPYAEVADCRMKPAQVVSRLPETEVVTVPVVVHVVHNPVYPERTVSEGQIHSMIDELNKAYGTTDEANVREQFKDVVGNPHIRFELAKTTPNGMATTGIVYYTTDKPYYPLTGEDVKEHYAYKFEKDGLPRNWDIKRYVNIYIVDLGGFDQKSNTGGFVTNPEPTTAAQFADQANWIEKQDTKFWKDWLASSEGGMLDGLTVDVFYTFGGLNEVNPEATFKTAIHELGHYFGLKHPNVVLLEKNGVYMPFDDGFEDTPYTQFTQYAVVDCDEPVYQCGTLVQTENYMDYALKCACMFTKEQAAFMRKFIEDVRPGLIASSSAIESSEKESGVVVSSVSADGKVYIQGAFVSAVLYSLSGVEMNRFDGGQTVVDVSGLSTGTYLLQVYETPRTSTVFKITVATN